MSPLALALLLSVSPVCSEAARTVPGPPAPGAATAPLAGSAQDTLQEHWESGTSFPRFLAEATRRRALWNRNYGEGEVPAELAARARAVDGVWRLLAVAVDGCSDSVNTLPWMALLAEAVPGLELRVISPEAGREIMEARRTADGRTATPTVVLLDEDYREVGCFIERPRALKAWFEEQRHQVGEGTLYEGKMLWYAQDAGRSTLEDVVELMERAGAGEPVCAPTF